MAVEGAGDAAVRRRYRTSLRARQADANRHAMIQAAHDLFVGNGFARTGVRDVAAAAGVAVETVYAHFSSKRHEEWIEEMLDRVLARS